MGLYAAVNGWALVYKGNTNSCMFDFDTSLHLFNDFLVKVSIAVMKHHDKKQVAEERVYLTYTYTL